MLEDRLGKLAETMRQRAEQPSAPVNQSLELTGSQAPSPIRPFPGLDTSAVLTSPRSRARAPELGQIARPASLWYPQQPIGAVVGAGPGAAVAEAKAVLPPPPPAVLGGMDDAAARGNVVRQHTQQQDGGVVASDRGQKPLSVTERLAALEAEAAELEEGLFALESLAARSHAPSSPVAAPLSVTDRLLLRLLGKKEEAADREGETALPAFLPTAGLPLERVVHAADPIRSQAPFDGPQQPPAASAPVPPPPMQPAPPLQPVGGNSLNQVAAAPMHPRALTSPQYSEAHGTSSRTEGGRPVFRLGSLSPKSSGAPSPSAGTLPTDEEEEEATPQDLIRSLTRSPKSQRSLQQLRQQLEAQ